MWKSGKPGGLCCLNARNTGLDLKLGQLVNADSYLLSGKCSEAVTRLEAGLGALCSELNICAPPLPIHTLNSYLGELDDEGGASLKG